MSTEPWPNKDPKARISELFQEQWYIWLAAIRLRTPPHFDHESILGDVLYKMLEKLTDPMSNKMNDGQLCAFFWTAIDNKIKDTTKYEKRHPAIPLSSLPTDPGNKIDPVDQKSVQPIDNLHQKDLRRTLEDAISSLSEHDQKIVRLRFFKGQTTQEVANSLGLPNETVSIRLCRALKKLRSILPGGREESP